MSTNTIPIISMLEFEPEGHPIYVAPDIPLYITQNVINLPAINFNDLIKLLEEILANQEKIEISKVNNYVFNIEFHPINGIKIYPKNISHKLKWFCGVDAAEKALEKYPHNKVEFNLEEIPPFGFRDAWFKMELRIFYSSKNDCYILEFNRLCGEAYSFHKIYKKLKAEIETTFSKPYVLWLLRKNYIKLFEGSKFSRENENHITHYLLEDELLLREICSYIYGGC